MQIKVKKLNEKAVLPTYAHDGDACFDLHAIIPDSQKKSMFYTSRGMCVQAESSHVFDTGLSFEIPEGHVMLIFSRSGHGFKNDVRLSNCVGVIDSGYRGEVKVKLTKDCNYSNSLYVHEEDRIAQAMIVPAPTVTFLEGELSDSERGTGGFGSSGK